MTRLLHPQNPPDPCNDLMRRRVSWFVQIDKARPVKSCIQKAVQKEMARLVLAWHYSDMYHIMDAVVSSLASMLHNAVSM